MKDKVVDANNTEEDLKLTTNAVELIVNNESTAKNSIVQIVSVKVVSRAVMNLPDRYRVVISDGRNYVQGMIADDLTHHVLSGYLVRNCTVKVVNYVTEFVNGNPLAIILDLEVKKKLNHRVGSPKEYNLNDRKPAGPQNSTN